MPERTATTEERIEERSGVDLGTLVIAALAAAIAAVVTSRLWQGGTLLSTAMTPVIVALVKEYLDRPVRKVTQVARAPLQAARETNSYRTVSVPAGRGSGRGAATAEPFEPAQVPLEPAPPDEEGALESPYRVYRGGARQKKWWVVGITTGVVAFVVAALALTLPELVGGDSVTGTGRTTLFHGKSSSSDQKSTDTTGTGRTTSTPSGQDEQGPSSGQPQQTTPSQTPNTRTTPQDQQQTPTASPTPTTAAPTTSTPSSSDAQP